MNSEELGNELTNIIEDFNNQKLTYRGLVNREDVPRETLLNFQGVFTDLKSRVRPIHTEVVKHYTLHDDKGATAIKYRIAFAISEGRFKNENDELLYDKCSINQAEKLASGSDVYKKFITQRAFWKESLVNITDLRDDISSYLIEISNRLR